MPADHFGLIARTSLPIPPGKWKFITTSDDGVRVTVGDKPVIDNLTWHVPTRDEGTYDSTTQAPTDIMVEYFEIDGFATLELEIQPVP